MSLKTLDNFGKLNEDLEKSQTEEEKVLSQTQGSSYVNSMS